MTKLEKDLQFLWNMQNIDRQVWLFLPNYKGTNIHIQLTKDARTGEYISYCSHPKFLFRDFSLRKLLSYTFIWLRYSCDSAVIDREHIATLERALVFMEHLKREPSLEFFG
jgi:hypothetical protein